jgi:hypothetical protein
MRIKSAVLITAILLTTMFAGSLPAMAQQTSVTVGAGGIYPAGTTFNGVPINGLQSATNGDQQILRGNIQIHK